MPIDTGPPSRDPRFVSFALKVTRIDDATVKTKRKLLVIHPNPCYSRFAFVALVSPLGKKSGRKVTLAAFFLRGWFRPCQN